MPGGRLSRAKPPCSIPNDPYASASARCRAISPMERPSGSGRKSYASWGRLSSNATVFAASRSHTSMYRSTSFFIVSLHYHLPMSTADLIIGFHGVRYQVRDVSRAAAFYRDHLGFTVEHQQLPAFAAVSLGALTVLLSGPGASGSRPTPAGQEQQPGGCNRHAPRAR